MHKLLAGTRVPAHWFYPQLKEVPLRHQSSQGEFSSKGQIKDDNSGSGPKSYNGSGDARKMHLEIVSHCWQYSHFLHYQLSSIVLHAPRKIDVTVTVFYASEDTKTQALLNFFSSNKPDNVTWNWQELPPPYLFRRAIGRNLAALNSSADWVWFTDCDETFQAGCLDALANLLADRSDPLLHPAIEYKTAPLTDDDLQAQATASSDLQLRDVKLDEFSANRITRATGPLQITHGDIARAFGYCQAVSCYQKPASSWCKAHEDRVFRWLLGTQGVAIDLPGVYRIQHQSKGRQQSDSTLNRFRHLIRNRRYRINAKRHKPSQN